MRRILALILFVSAAVSARAVTVTGNLALITGNASAGQRVTFDPLDAPFIQSPSVFLPISASTTSDASGNFTISLNPGAYRMSVEGRPVLFIRVASDVDPLNVANAPLVRAVYLVNWPDALFNNVTATNSFILGTNTFTAPANIPLWNGGAWPGSGGITNISVSGSGIGVTGSPLTPTNTTLTLTLQPHTHAASDINSGLLSVARLLSSYADNQIPFVSGTGLSDDPQFTYDPTNKILYVPALVTSSLFVNGTNSPPANYTSPGLPGQWAWDTNYIYLCTATNFWEKTPISTNGAVGGSAVWGSITGTLSSQTDLQTALNGKQAAGNYITALAGDVTASGPGSVAATVAAINGAALGTTTATAGNVLIATNSTWKSTAISGDATLSSGGVLTVGAGAITSSKLASGAAASNLGSAGGDLTGTYPSPTVANINGVALGTTTATAGNVLVATNSTWKSTALSGDATLSSGGVVTLKSTGTPGTYGDSSHTLTITTDTQGRVSSATANSPSFAGSVITSGVVGSSVGGAGSVNGIMKANGSGTVSAAVSSTDYAPATSGSAILKGNGSGGFSSAVSGTDYAPATSGTTLLKGNGSGGTTAIQKYGFPLTFAPTILPASGFCRQDTGGTGFQLLFAQNENGLWLTQIPRFYQTNLEVDLNYSMDTATSGSVIWQVEVWPINSGDSRANSTQNFSAATLVTNTVPGTINFPKAVTLSGINAGTTTNNTTFILRITRKDALSGNAILISPPVINYDVR